MTSNSSSMPNKHGNFKEIEAARPDWSTDLKWTMTKTKNPDWALGDGANDGGMGLQKEHIEIDPYAKDRTPASNYKLLISAIIPRPVAFISTLSPSTGTANLAPYSYMQIMSHDPPLFVIGLAGGAGSSTGKDTARNLAESGECVINMLGEAYLEAGNAASVDAPAGVSEWPLTGLHPAPCSTVACARVREAVFAIEAKLVDLKEYPARSDPGRTTVAIATVEGTRIWCREDALNEKRDAVDCEVLRPIARLGGITYSRLSEGVELARPVYKDVAETPKVKSLLS